MENGLFYFGTIIAKTNFHFQLGECAMKPTIPAITLLTLSLLLVGCVSVFVPVQPPVTQTALPTVLLPTNPPPPVQSVVPPTASSAPLCTADPLAAVCTPPTLEERDRHCTKKIPYTFLVIPPGSTWEPVESGLQCGDEGVRGGMQMISCTGQNLYSYDLKVCNSTCSAGATLMAGTAQCPDGYGYHPAGNCCWPMPAPDFGCKVYTVNIGTCE
jgi:hypothetical protein